MNELRIYRLTGPSVLVAQQEVIRRGLFGFDKRSPDTQFDISPVSGWCYYADHAELYRNKSPNLLPRDEAHIRKAAADWLQACQARYDKASNVGSGIKGLPPVLPGVMRVADIEPAFRPQTLLVDHWVVRFDIYLRASGEFGQSSVPVLGSGLDLRIGNRGRVIGLFLRWRPVEAAGAARAIAHEEAKKALNDGPHVDASEESAAAEAPPQIVYELQGESSHQTHLCPYYFHPSGHHRQLLPASAESLAVTFRQKVSENFVEVKAQIAGGSGQFDLSWSHWSAGNPRGEGYQQRSGDGPYRLPGGVHNLLLIARDRRSGQVAQRQETIYAATGGAPEPLSIERPGCTDPASPNYDADANVDDGSCAPAPSV